MFDIELTANTPTMELTGAGSALPVWGIIGGTLSNQTDLQNALNAKANIATTLAGYGITDVYISGGTITIGSNTITPITDVSGKADITYVNTQLATKANIATTLNGYGITDAYTKAETDALLGGKVTSNNAITGATKCKVTYDSKGLVTAGADLSAGDIPDLSSVYYPVTNPSGYISGITSAMVTTALGYTPQPTLTAGANIQINGGTISATDTTYTAGTGISIVGGTISNTQTSAEWGNIEGTLSEQTDLQNALDSKLSAVPVATTSTLGGVIVGNGLSVNASGTVSVAEKPLETEFSYRLDSPAKQVVVAEANASMGNILSTDTTIASKIINNVPLSNNMSMSLLIPASMKQEIIAEVNAGVLVTIYTILDTDTTLARRIINSAPLSSGTFNLTEVNNG